MDAFDADVLIYAAVSDHPLGSRVLALFVAAQADDPARPVGIGSLLLLPEVLGRPLRDAANDELRALSSMLSRLDLRPLDKATAQLAVALGARYRLRAADAVHLATAVGVGADRFLTNNHRDFPTTISEIEIAYPANLPDPGEPTDASGSDPQ